MLKEFTEFVKHYGVIGLAIILSAYAIARFVVNSLVNATS